MTEWLLEMSWFISGIGAAACDFVEAIIERLKRGEENGQN